MSTHPDAAIAVGEVVGGVLERLGERPDVTIAFISDEHLASVSNIHAALRGLVGGSLIGSTSSSIIGGAREVEEAPAVALWSATIDDATPVRFSMTPGQDLISDPPTEDVIVDTESTLILVADPYSFPVDEAIAELELRHPGLTVVGGLSSPSKGPGTVRMFFDDEITSQGAVGLVIGQGRVLSMVSQGCRPIGVPMTITACDGNRIDSIAGQTALSQLERLFGDLTEDDQRLVNTGLHVGRVVDERKATFDRGDFLIRAVIGADHSTGSIVIGDHVNVGDTIQFQIRDASSAREDLRLSLWNAGAASSALLFSCNGRGIGLFEEFDHDAGAVNERLGIDAVAGMFCAGEIGPVAHRSFVHGFTASMAFFVDDAR